MATAESCTGGWIAKAITDVAGSSEWFEAGYVTYSNVAKQKMLGVKAGTLARFGAVSEGAVREMARGALRATGADIAIAVSGVAGPGGGSPGKPVGLVWFCWAKRSGRSIHLRVLRRRFRGDREAVRSKAVAVALRGVLSL
jgi:nicotinamide-nucleotide amidase